MTGENTDLTLSTPLTGSCNLPFSGTADMKRVTAALRQVILPYPWEYLMVASWEISLRRDEALLGATDECDTAAITRH